jgi:hypothetical protein
LSNGCRWNGRLRSQIAGKRHARLQTLQERAVTISGIELMHRIRNGQFDLTNVRLKETTAPAVWMAVLSAC